MHRAKLKSFCSGSLTGVLRRIIVWESEMQHKLAEPSDVGPTTFDAATTEEIQRFVDGLYARSRAIHVCMRCGSVRQFADATFSLWNGKRSWIIPLPICPKCDLTSEMLKLDSSQVA
jgi:hypothetical protein